MSTTDFIFNDLTERLVNGGFAQNAKLKPEDLCKDYDCSASALREILLRLSTEGLVDYREQRGFRMPVTDETRLHDLAQFRILLECEGAVMSIRNGGLAWEARLSAAHHKLSHIEKAIHSMPSPKEVIKLWSSAEREFHQTLIGACGSMVLQKTHARVYLQFRQANIVQDQSFPHVVENNKQHSAIIEAALAHDEDMVRQTIHAHLSRNLSAEQSAA